MIKAQREMLILTSKQCSYTQNRYRWHPNARRKWICVSEFLGKFRVNSEIQCMERRPVLLQTWEVYMIVCWRKLGFGCFIDSKWLPLSVLDTNVIRSCCRLRIMVRATSTDWYIPSDEHQGKGGLSCNSRRSIARRRNHWWKCWHVRGRIGFRIHHHIRGRHRGLTVMLTAFHIICIPHGFSSCIYTTRQYTMSLWQVTVVKGRSLCSFCESSCRSTTTEASWCMHIIMYIWSWTSDLDDPHPVCAEHGCTRTLLLT